MKRCTRCNLVKTHGEFNRARGNADGLQNRCRQCQAAYQQAIRVGYQPRKKLSKYLGCEYVRNVRKMTSQEIAEFQSAIDRGPPKMIRLNVSA